MLVDCKLKTGQIERCLIDRDWPGVLEVLFSAYGSHNIVWIADVDDVHLTWFNQKIDNPLE